ncbi:MAG: hypothetical protein ACK5LO_05250 [Leucobacter sp.]
MSDFHIPDGALESAGASLVGAANLMVTGNTARVAGVLESLTGIGTEVDLYLRGLSVGRAALADAAKTASEAVGALMLDSSALDGRLSGALASGFAVQGRS